MSKQSDSPTSINGVHAIGSRSIALRYSVVLFAAFLLVFGLIVWFTEGNSKRDKEADLAFRTKTFRESLQITLEGNKSYLEMLGFERSAGKLNASLFQERASQYAQSHPELIDITWVDAHFTITDVAPLVPNRQIVGLPLNLPEPKRASHLAREQRKAVYTRPFEAIQGKPSFEIWVPVFQGEKFLGLFAGVYSCEGLLKQLVTQTRPRLHHLSLTDINGRILAAAPKLDATDRDLLKEVLITDEASGILLRVQRYQSQVDWRLSLLKALSLVLVAGIGYALWQLKRGIEDAQAGR